MRCIQSPWWDGLFIWSGLPIGLMLAAFFIGGHRDWLMVCFVVFLALDAAHLMSPMALTVALPPLRQLALAEPIKFIAMPTALIVLPTLLWGQLGKFAGYGLLIQGGWNAYHFGMQNFGVTQIYRRLWNKPGRRWIDQAVCVGIALFFLLPPYAVIISVLGLSPPNWLKGVSGMSLLPVAAMFIVIGMLNVNHWLTAMALTWKVMRLQWWWVVVLGGLGFTGYYWAHPFGGKYHGIQALVFLNVGIGFAHFWVDGLIWKRSSPTMQAVLA